MGCTLPKPVAASASAVAHFRHALQRAHSLQQQGHLRAALDLLQGASQEMVPLLGSDHPSVVECHAQLASTLHRVGRHTDAVHVLRMEVLPLLLRQQQQQQQQQQQDGSGGEETRQVYLRYQVLLAAALLGTGQQREALDLLEEVVPQQEALLGAQHRDCWESREQWAVALQQAGDTVAAMLVYQDLVCAVEEALGPEDTATLVCRHNCACMTSAAGRHVQALAMLQVLVKRWERRLSQVTTPQQQQRQQRGDSATRGRRKGRRGGGGAWEEREIMTHLMATKSKMASVMDQAGSTAMSSQAVALLEEEVIPWREEHLGSTDVDTLTSKMYLAQALLRVGRLQDAVRVAEETVEGRAHVLGEDHVDTGEAKSLLLLATERQLREDMEQGALVAPYSAAAGVALIPFFSLPGDKVNV